MWDCAETEEKFDKKKEKTIVSAERGTLVTVEFVVCAMWKTIPPMFVIPRLKYSKVFTEDQNTTTENPYENGCGNNKADTSSSII